MPLDRVVRWDFYNYAGRFDTNVLSLGTKQDIAETLRLTYAGQLGALVQGVELPSFDRHPAFKAVLRKMNYPVIIWQFTPSTTTTTPYFVTRFHPDENGDYTIQASPSGGIPDALKKAS